MKQRKPIDHFLKVWPAYFKEIQMGRKKFELRKNDRDFRIGDMLILQEWDNETEEYTGKDEYVIVNYIFNGGMMGIEKGYCIMSIDKIQI